MLRPMRLASASAEAGTNTAFIAFCRIFCCMGSTTSLDQSDLTTLTRTRVPSLLMAIVSERRTNARICVRPAGVVDSLGGKARAHAFSTEHKT